MHWPSVLRQELEVFRFWLVRHHEPTTFEDMWGLLKVVHLLQTTSAYPVAIRGFKSLELTHWQKLAISSRWPIWHWLKPIIHFLILNHPIDEITAEQALAMGFRTYHIVVQAKAKIMDLRLCAFAVAPSLELGPAAGCIFTAHTGCRNAWHCLWTEDLRSRVLHPDFPLALETRAIMDCIVSIKAPKLNQQCREAYMRNVQQAGHLDYSTQVILPKVFEVVMKHHKAAHLDRADWEQWDH
ncbi:hypothetical protein AAF712_014276 [Marasmius tenuissimus]|uniref:Uncharacterized protein n=1 Tax=Marasmius tenuissimus TaxID=585030 RepID=A0ABR2ZEZ0_9AGAR